MSEKLSKLSILSSSSLTNGPVIYASCMAERKKNFGATIEPVVRFACYRDWHAAILFPFNGIVPCRVSSHRGHNR